jgi:hypothetical protein
MQFSPASRHFLPLRHKYSPQNPVLKHSQRFVSKYFQLMPLPQNKSSTGKIIL